jgi:hypothetical protein
VKRSPALSYALQCSLLAIILALGLLLTLRSQSQTFLGFAMLGWGVMALTAVPGGAWVASRHGRSLTAFLVALQSCMLARLALAAGGAFVAWKAGGDAVRAFLIGLVVGFLPLQTFEIIWFYRRTQKVRFAGNEPQSGPGIE